MPKRGTVDFSKMKWGVPEHTVDERDLVLTFNSMNVPILHAATGSRAGLVELFPGAAPVVADDIDFTDDMPPVEDQGQTPQCTAYGSLAIVSRFNYRDLKRQGKKSPRKEDFCEEHLYNEARRLANYNDVQTGLHPRDALEYIRQFGALPQREWDSLRGRPKKKGDALTELLGNYKIQVYSSVNQGNIDDVRQALATFGPLVASIYVWQEWEHCGGVMEMPAPNESIVGRHTIDIAGCFHSRKMLKIRNSWGNWAAGGYAEMPYDDFQRCCFTLWSAIDLPGSKDLYPANAWEQAIAKWPQWLKDAFGIPL